MVAIIYLYENYISRNNKKVNIFNCSCHLPIVILFTVTKPITVQQYTDRFMELGLLNFIIIMRIDFSRIETNLFYFNFKKLQLTILTTCRHLS